MKEKEYIYHSLNHIKLCGILSKTNKKTNKCILLCHGITTTKEEDGIFTELAKKLYEQGLDSFRFDFRGHGDSEGKSEDMDIKGEVNDIQYSIKFLQKKGYKSFSIISASFAGGPTSLFVHKNQNIIDSITFWNPIIDYNCLLIPKTPWAKKYFGIDAIKRLDKAGFLEIGSYKFRISHKLIDSMKSTYSIEKYKLLKLPILIIHGNKDTYVSYQDSIKYNNMLKNSTLKSVVGAEHGFQGNEKWSNEAIKTSIDFLKQYI